MAATLRSSHARAILLPALVLAVMTGCGETPTETAPPDAAPLPAGLDAAVASAQGANPESNGQIFMASPVAGFGVVNFPMACFVFDTDGPEPDSWLRMTQEEILTMEHTVVQNGVLLVGSFFTGLQEGSGHGSANVHFRRDGAFNGLTFSVNGKLVDGTPVSCKLTVGPDGEVRQSFIRVNER